MDPKTNKHYVGIVGARVRSSMLDEYFVDTLVSSLKKRHGDKLVIVSGGCKQGADAFAKKAWTRHNVDHLEFPVVGSFKNKWEWTQAAYERNTEVALNSLDSLFALVQVPRKGGTEDTITKYENLIIADNVVDVTRRALYIVFPDMKIERWTPAIKRLSDWEIWNGNVSRQD